MKKMLLFAAAVGMMTALSAEVVKSWQFAEKKCDARFSQGKIQYALAKDKTPDGKAAGEFTILKNDTKTPYNITIEFNYAGKVAKGETYKLRFYAKADKPITVSGNFQQNQKPWKVIGYFGVLKLTDQWKEYTLTGKMDNDSMNTYMPWFHLGTLPVGTKIFLGPVTLEK